jgi:hypothetical protein
MRFVVSKADKGDFLNQKLAWDILRQTAHHNQEIPSTIDLSQCLHLKPYSVACLAAIGAKMGGGIPLVWPTDPPCRDHLIRLGFHNWFVVDEVPVVEQRETNVPIRQLVNTPGTFSDEAMTVWEQELGGLPGGMRQIFANHLDEMIYNALGHSRSCVGCFVVGQAFPLDGFVDVSILDLGITILGHLRQNPPYAHIGDDSEAIKRSFEEGVTGTPVGSTNLLGQPNSGVGLTELVSFCDSGGGVISVVSGNNCVCRSRNGESVFPIKHRFEGTLVNIRFLS